MKYTYYLKFFFIRRIYFVQRQEGEVSKVRSLKGLLILLFFNFFLSGNAYSQFSEQNPSVNFMHQQSEHSGYADRTPFSTLDDGFNIFGKSGNILYGPPGPPISGVAPVGDGIWFSLFLIICYGLFRSFFLKKQAFTQLKKSN